MLTNRFFALFSFLGCCCLIRFRLCEKVYITELPPSPAEIRAAALSANQNNASCPKNFSSTNSTPCKLYCNSFKNAEHLIFCYGGSAEEISQFIQEFASAIKNVTQTTTTTTITTTPVPNSNETLTTTSTAHVNISNSDPDTNLTFIATTPNTATEDVTQINHHHVALGIQSSEFETIEAAAFEPLSDMITFIAYHSCLHMNELPDMSNMRRVRELQVHEAPKLLHINSSRLPKTSSTFMTFRRTGVNTVGPDSFRGNLFYLSLSGDSETSLRILPEAFRHVPALNFLQISNYNDILAADDAFPNTDDSSRINQITLSNINLMKITPTALRWLRGARRTLRVLELLKLPDADTVANNSFSELYNLDNLVLSDNRQLQSLERDASTGLANLTLLVLEHSPLQAFDARAPFFRQEQQQQQKLLPKLQQFVLQTRFPRCTCALRSLREVLVQRALPFSNRAEDYDCVHKDQLFIVKIANAADQELSCDDAGDGQQPTPPTTTITTTVASTVQTSDDNKTLPDELIETTTTTPPPPPAVMHYKLSQEFSLNLPPSAVGSSNAAAPAALSQQGVTSKKADSAAAAVYADAIAAVLKALALGGGGGSNNNNNNMPPILVFKGEPGDKGYGGIHGLDGLPGLKGNKGERGNDGIPGTPGAKGEAGDRGERGIPGAPGTAGEKGSRGMTGPPGTYGEPGAKGQQGEVGVAGPPGVKGEEGEAGTMGPMGAPGESGEKGDAGVKGEMGFQGWPGPKGDKGSPGILGQPGIVGALGEKGQRGNILLPPPSTPTQQQRSTQQEILDKNSVFFEQPNLLATQIVAEDSQATATPTLVSLALTSTETTTSPAKLLIISTPSTTSAQTTATTNSSSNSTAQ